MVDPPETTTGLCDDGVTAPAEPEEVEPLEAEPDDEEPDDELPEEVLPEAEAGAAPGSWCATTPATTAAAAAAVPATHRATRLGRARATSRRSRAEGGRERAGIVDTSSSILLVQPETGMNFALAFPVTGRLRAVGEGRRLTAAFSQVNAARSSHYTP